MDMDQLILLGIVPAALVVVAGMLVRKVSGRRFLLFLLAANAALLFTALIAGWLTPEQDFVVATLLAPGTLGILALTILHLREGLALWHGETILALALGLISVALLAGLGVDQRFGTVYTYTVVPGAVVLAIVWTLARVSRPIAVGLVAAALALLGSCNAMSSGAWIPPQLPQPPAWLLIPLQLFFFALPGLVPVTAAVLVSTGLKPYTPSGATRMGSRWPAIWRLSLAAVLLGYLAYTIVWASVWDNTSDGLGGLFLSMPTGLIAVGAGMVMAASSSGRRRLAGLVFGVLVPLTIFGAFNYGWSVSYQALTESHAVRIQAAVERFHTRTGSYPAELTQLVPKDLWWIPEPVILRGQGWCYQGGKDFYRLGAVFRENWSLPLSVRIYGSVGSAPETTWECDQKLAELKSRYDPQPAAGMPNAAPTLAP